MASLTPEEMFNEEAAMQGKALDSDERLNKLCSEYKEVYDKVEEMEAFVTKVKAIKEERRDKLAAYMNARKIPSIKFKGLGHFLCRRDPHPALTKDPELKHEFFKLMEEWGEGGIVKTDIHPSTMRSWYNGSKSKNTEPVHLRLFLKFKKWAEKQDNLEIKTTEDVKEYLERFIDSSAYKDVITIRKV